MTNCLSCPVCNGPCSFLDVVDFNKSCAESWGVFLELTGVPVYYVICQLCQFTFAPDVAAWTLQEFEDRIYNKEYINVDPEYARVRPEKNAKNLVMMFGEKPGLKHLDYGGGGGLLSQILGTRGWQSISYDPFVDKQLSVNQLGQFDLITAFEVFEHVPDVDGLMNNLRSLLSPNGLVLFSTLVSDGNLQLNRRITWWYASPRNGHISLFSKSSLMLLAKQRGFNFGSFSDGFHVFFEQVPYWAQHLIHVG